MCLTTYRPALLVVCTTALLSACDRPGARPGADAGADSATIAADTANQPRGLKLEPPKPLPDIVLTDTDGKSFDLRRQTAGYVTLLFFGYTHCPDVCPVHMANIARALKGMPAPEAGRIKVVFITTDPERDTPRRIRDWLDAFDPTFIGLRGTMAEIRQAETAAKLPPSAREVTDSSRPGEYTVGHAAFVIAATADGTVRYLYPFGFRQADWAHDLPRLVAMAPTSAVHPDAGVEVLRAYAFAPPTPSEAAAYFVARNTGAAADTLVAVSAIGAAGAAVHAQETHDGRVHMKAQARIPIAAGDSLVLEPGGSHLMLVDLRRKPVPGDTMRVTLQFARAGALAVALPVRAYGDPQ
jgi:protein SCO1/2